MGAAWRDVQGVTTNGGRARLPYDPNAVVEGLALVIETARTSKVSLESLRATLRSKLGWERRRIEGLLQWLTSTHVARWTDGNLDLHPATNLQDLAFRLAAWAGVEVEPDEDQTLLQRWVHELLKAATAHPQALTRPTTAPKKATAWVQADWPPLQADDGSHDPDSPLAARLRRILDALDGALLERQVHTRAVLLALLAGQHALLLGPPGTAKSLLARALCTVFRDATYFEYLLSRFTHPDELFGPVSIPGLKEEDYRRLTEGFLPQAHVAFLDEVFKANSAILNSLLTLINERVFHHGRHRDPAPLLGLIGASNELPAADGGLDALYDRFLVRLPVPPLGSAEAFLAVATGRIVAPQIAEEDRLSLQDVAELRARAATVAVPEVVQGALAALWAHAHEKAWPVSDRRWRQAVQLLQVAAAADGRDEIAPIDLLLLEPCLAWDPSEGPQVRAAILEHLQPVAAPTHDLPVQWGLVWSDRVAPTPTDPVPVGDAPSPWRDRLARRQAAVARFFAHHSRALDVLAIDRQSLEAAGERHLWIPTLPVTLLEPHLDAARQLAAWLRKAESYRVQINSPEDVCEAVLGWLPTEERVRPEHMDAIVAVGHDMAVGLSYKAWRRIPGVFEGTPNIRIPSETFLDWLDGTVPTHRFLAGHDQRTRRHLDHGLPVLHEQLVRHRLPDPGSAPDRP